MTCSIGQLLPRPSPQPSKSELRSSRPRAERGEGAHCRRVIFLVPRRDVVISEALIEQAEEEESGML